MNRDQYMGMDVHQATTVVDAFDLQGKPMYSGWALTEGAPLVHKHPQSFTLPGTEKTVGLSFVLKATGSGLETSLSETMFVATGFETTDTMFLGLENDKLNWGVVVDGHDVGLCSTCSKAGEESKQ